MGKHIDLEEGEHDEGVDPKETSFWKAMLEYIAEEADKRVEETGCTGEEAFIAVARENGLTVEIYGDGLLRIMRDETDIN